MKVIWHKKVLLISIIILICALTTPVLAQTTSLIITASPSNPTAGDAFTVSGALTDAVTGEGLVGQFVTVEVSTNGVATFIPAAQLVTFTDGAFDVDQIQTVTGTYMYRATFAGTTQFGPSVSNRVKVTVGVAPGPEPTALTVTASPSNLTAGDPFTVSGFLTDGVTGEGLAGSFVTVELSIDNGTSFSPVSDVFTLANGAFVLGQTQTAVGTYVYRVTFTGTLELAPSVSNLATVNVGAAATSQALSQAVSQTVGVSNPSSGDVFMVGGFMTEGLNDAVMPGEFVSGLDQFA